MEPGSRRETPHRIVFGWGGVALVALLAAACGGSDPAAVDTIDSSPSPDGTTSPSSVASTSSVATSTSVAATATTVAQAGRTVEDVAPATVKLITEGAPLDPFSTGADLIEKIGSGFLVHSDGLVVTTYHSMAQYDGVTAYLFDSAEPIEGTVVAVSECNDLALIDLAGDGYPILDWRSEPFSPGLEVFSAGYPLNLDTDLLDADYTLTAGIVSTAGRTESDLWVAVDGVIEHDARIRGGSSGGPLVDERGDVVGVNFAGDDVNDLNYAIAVSVAADIVARLGEGDVDSIGIDGEAASDGAAAGVWVSGVRPDTLAAAAGLQQGDLITALGGEDLSGDPTLQTFCDVLRSTDTPVGLDLEVFRTPTGEVLTGTLGGATLVVDPASVDPAGSSDDESGDDDSGAYEFVADESESIGVEIPVAWDDRDGSPNPTFGPSLYASPDLEGFESTWDVPGLIIEFDPGGGTDDIGSTLDGLLAEECTSLGRADFATDDGAFVGRSEVLAECGGTGTRLFNFAGTRADGRTLVRLQIQMVDDDDVAIAERAVGTFDAVIPD